MQCLLEITLTKNNLINFIENQKREIYIGFIGIANRVKINIRYESFGECNCNV